MTPSGSSVTSFRLSSVAPRLARARDQWIAHRIETGHLELLRATKLLELERLVAHRELQLVRAMATRRPAYIAQRQRKLTQARARLAAVQKRPVLNP